MIEDLEKTEKSNYKKTSAKLDEVIENDNKNAEEAKILIADSTTAINNNVDEESTKTNENIDAAVEELETAIAEARIKINKYTKYNADKVNENIDAAEEYLDNAIIEARKKINNYTKYNADKVNENIDAAEEYLDNAITEARKAINKYTKYNADVTNKNIDEAEEALENAIESARASLSQELSDAKDEIILNDDNNTARVNENINYSRDILYTSLLNVQTNLANVSEQVGHNVAKVVRDSRDTLLAEIEFTREALYNKTVEARNIITDKVVEVGTSTKTELYNKIVESRDSINNKTVEVGTSVKTAVLNKIVESRDSIKSNSVSVGTSVKTAVLDKVVSSRDSINGNIYGLSTNMTNRFNFVDNNVKEIKEDINSIITSLSTNDTINKINEIKDDTSYLKEYLDTNVATNANRADNTVFGKLHSISSNVKVIKKTTENNNSLITSLSTTIGTINDGHNDGTVFARLNNIRDVSNTILKEQREMQEDIDQILINTTLKTVNSNTIKVLAGLYEEYYTANPSATTEEKMAFVTDWLQRYGYLK